MQVVIKECGQANIADIGQCDGAFTVDAKLVLSVEDNVIRYDIVSVPAFTKRYEEDHVPDATYLDGPDKAVLLAYVDGQVAGQVLLRRNWNNYAFVEGIVVDRGCRRRGVGSALIAHVAQWAKERDLAGIMLETQDVNAGACRFYERCGFELRGFDTRLYSGLDSATDEIALYWYLVFSR